MDERSARGMGREFTIHVEFKIIESAPYTAYPPGEAPLMLFGSQACFICRAAVRLALFIEYTQDAVRMQR